MEQAWIEIETDYDEAWDRFDAQFHFCPSTRPVSAPGIDEPTPSETYSIAHIYGRNEDHSAELNDGLMAFALGMFQHLVPQGEWLYALDWQHPAYKFYPHVPFSLDESGEWPVPILPNGDYYIFLEKGFKWGVFGHPWEQTMCFWGEGVLKFLHANRPRLLTEVVRMKA